MLLSIVIPTKNRQFTALYAIESALLINNDDFEVIVQDCSDTNILAQQIQEKFGSEPKIKYFYSNEQLSMTENWNRAFFNTSGEYICAIGDDDAIFPVVYEIAKWAKQRNLDMVKHPKMYYCSWPGNMAEYPEGYVFFNKKSRMTGTYSIIQADIEKLHEYCTLKHALYYLDLPNVYHCIFSRHLIEDVKKDTGVFLDALALDAYIGVVLFKYIKEFALVSYPFTLPGSAPNSNTHRIKSGAIALHINEFNNLNFPDFLPEMHTLSTTVAQSVYAACKNTHQEELLGKINLPCLYANIYLESTGNFRIIFKKLRQYKKNKMDYVIFYLWILNGYMKKMRLGTKAKVMSILQKYFPGFFTKLRSKYGITGSIQVNNSMEAVSAVNNELRDIKLLLS